MIRVTKRLGCRRLFQKSTTYGYIGICMYATFIFVSFVRWNLTNNNTTPVLFELVNPSALVITTNPKMPKTTMSSSRQASAPQAVTQCISNDTIHLSNFVISKWMNKTTKLCNGKFIGYSKLFANLHDVVIDPEFGRGLKGGENLNDVLNQREETEYIDLLPGYFSINCEHESINQYFGFRHHEHFLRNWNAALTSSGTKGAKIEIADFTIALTRHEYVNLYHTMTEFYNAFLMLLIFKQNPENTVILFVDGHPAGSLDEVWSTLFGKIVRAGHLSQPVKFSNMAWSMIGYSSPLEQHYEPNIPHVEDFRNFFLSRFHIEDRHKLNCNNISLLLIWRKDYLAHPRNPKGQVTRKIQNEEQLKTAISKELLGHHVRDKQLDLLSMNEQLKLISQTDILVGMHGAGLSHTLFLPKHAGLIEFYPIYWPQANRHFQAMAQWRHIHYSNWQNTEKEYEFPDYKTYIPPKTAVQMVHEMRHKLCGDH